MLEDYCHFHPRDKTKYYCEFCNEPICKKCTLEITFSNKDSHKYTFSRYAHRYYMQEYYSKKGIVFGEILQYNKICPVCYYDTKIKILSQPSSSGYDLVFFGNAGLALFVSLLYFVLELIPNDAHSPYYLILIIIVGIPPILYFTYKFLMKYVFIPRKTDSYKKAKEDFLRSVNKI